jgi:hypothetical protein
METTPVTPARRLNSAKRAAVLLSMFSPEAREGLIDALQLNSTSIKADANLLNADTNHVLSRGLSFLDFVPDDALLSVAVGFIATIRADRALIVVDPKHAKHVADYLGVPVTLVTRFMPSAKELLALEKKAESSVEKKQTLKATKTLLSALAVRKPGTIASRILPMYMYLGKALRENLTAETLMIEQMMGSQLEMGDPMSDPTEHLHTSALREVGDAFEHGDPAAPEEGDAADAGIDIASGLAGGALGVITSRAVRGMFRRKRRQRRAAAAAASSPTAPPVAEALTTTTGNEEDVARNAKAQYTNQPVEPPPADEDGASSEVDPNAPGAQAD